MHCGRVYVDSMVAVDGWVQNTTYHSMGKRCVRNTIDFYLSTLLMVHEWFILSMGG